MAINITLQDIQFRRNTSSFYTNNNPTLLLGEPAFETDTNRLKIGDGVTDWNSLPYLTESTNNGNGLSQEQIEDLINNLIVPGLGVTKTYDDNGNQLTLSLSGEEFTSALKSKLDNIESNAEINPSGSEIVASIDTTLGNESWKAPISLEDIQDIVGLMLTSGSLTNITTNYDDVNGTIDLTVTQGSGGIQTTTNYTTLQAISNPQDGDKVEVLGDANAPKIGGIFIYDSALSTTNNKGTIINGWVRENAGTLKPEYFGAFGDWDDTSGTDDSQAFTDMFAALNTRDVGFSAFTHTNQNVELTPDTMYYTTGFWDLANRQNVQIQGNNATIVYGGTVNFFRTRDTHRLTFRNANILVLNDVVMSIFDIYLLRYSTFQNIGIYKNPIFGANMDNVIAWDLTAGLSDTGDILYNQFDKIFVRGMGQGLQLITPDGEGTFSRVNSNHFSNWTLFCTKAVKLRGIWGNLFTNMDIESATIAYELETNGAGLVTKNNEFHTTWYENSASTISIVDPASENNIFYHFGYNNTGHKIGESPSTLNIFPENFTELFYKNNLLPNSDFAIAAGYGTTSGVDLTGGNAVFTITNGSLEGLDRGYRFTSGSLYKVTFDFTGDSSASMKIQDNAANTGGLIAQDTQTVGNGSTQTLEFIFRANENSKQLYISRGSGTGDYTFTIDNLELYRLTASEDIYFDNTGTSLLANNVQDAIVEVATNGSTGEPNAPLASQAEAETGTENTKTMTPLRTAQAIAALSTGTGSSPLTTKGDLYTFSTNDERLALGTQGQVLAVDTSTATGLTWLSAPPSTVDETADYNWTGGHNFQGATDFSNTSNFGNRITIAQNQNEIRGYENNGLGKIKFEATRIEVGGDLQMLNNRKITKNVANQDLVLTTLTATNKIVSERNIQAPAFEGNADAMTISDVNGDFTTDTIAGALAELAASGGSTPDSSQVPYTNNSQTTVEGALDAVFLDFISKGDNDLGNTISDSLTVSNGDTSAGNSVAGSSINLRAADDRQIDLSVKKSTGGNLSAILQHANGLRLVGHDNSMITNGDNVITKDYADANYGGGGALTTDQQNRLINASKDPQLELVSTDRTLTINDRFFSSGADIGRKKVLLATSEVTLTVPNLYDINDIQRFETQGSGVINLIPDTGVTILYKDKTTLEGVTMNGEGTVGYLKKQASGSWIFKGEDFSGYSPINNLLTDSNSFVAGRDSNSIGTFTDESGGNLSISVETVDVRDGAHAIRFETTGTGTFLEARYRLQGGTTAPSTLTFDYKIIGVDGNASAQIRSFNPTGNLTADLALVQDGNWNTISIPYDSTVDTNDLRLFVNAGTSSSIGKVLLLDNMILTED